MSVALKTDCSAPQPHRHDPGTNGCQFGPNSPFDAGYTALAESYSEAEQRDERAAARQRYGRLRGAGDRNF